jgi:hypothetical protein
MSRSAGEEEKLFGRENLPLYDREIDFDLIQPTGVGRSVDEDRVGPFGSKAVDGLLAAMSGAVVRYPQAAASGLVGLLVHDFTDETLYWSHPILDSQRTKDLGAMNVASRQIGPGALAKVFVLNTDGPVWTGGNVRLFSAPSLNAGLLVG